jgi:hypothetical protein
VDLFNKIHWENQSLIQHYHLLGANANYTNLQVPVWRIGHASGVFVVTHHAEEWFLMTKAEKKLERDAKRSSISKYALKKLRKAIPSHDAGVPFGPQPPAAAISLAAASPDNEGPVPPDQPSMPVPPPSTRGSSARVVEELSTGKVLNTEWVNCE